MPMVKNPKWEALSRLHKYVSTQNHNLGFSAHLGSNTAGYIYSTAINAKDVWESKLADNQALHTRKEINSLATTLIDIAREISSQMAQLDECIDENDPLAEWPN